MEQALKEAKEANASSQEKAVAPEVVSDLKRSLEVGDWPALSVHTLSNSAWDSPSCCTWLVFRIHVAAWLYYTDVCVHGIEYS